MSAGLTGFDMMQRGPDFAQLLVRHDRALLRYIQTFIPRRDDAEEVLQRAATVLWEKFGDYDPQREFLPWALRVTYFEILNFRKEIARSRLVFREDVLEAIAETREQQESALEDQHVALVECLKRVGDEGISLLRRRYCDSATLASLAHEQGRTAKSLYRRLDRLREMITECIERRLAGERA
jgi:RNA polymerase sigma-70 factor (ECF subfamily)